MPHYVSIDGEWKSAGAINDARLPKEEPKEITKEVKKKTTKKAAKKKEK